MENKNIILIAIVVLVIALVCVSAYVLTDNNDEKLNSTLNTTQNNTQTNVSHNITNATVEVNDTVKLNNTDNNNTTHRVYNPQNDDYVTVIGEGYDSEVDRWYTYDSDGVRYYNTRIN